MFIQQKQERNYTHKNNAPKGARRKAMQDLINEIRKLIEYAGENGKIQKQDIDKLCIKKIESGG